MYSGYNIDAMQIKTMVYLIIKSWPDVTEEIFYDYILNAKMGKCGMIYSSPVSFMVAMEKYRHENGFETKPVIKINTKDGLI